MRVASRVLNDGQPMLDTDEVGEPTHSASRAEKVTELRRTVDGGGVENDVVMYVPPVRVGTDDVGVTPLEEAFSQLAANEVCFFGRDLAGLKRLPYVVCNNPRLSASLTQRILPLRECELSRNELRRAAVGIDQ